MDSYSFVSACSFRFELTFDGFEPSEIARKTEKGLAAVNIRMQDNEDDEGY